MRKTFTLILALTMVGGLAPHAGAAPAPESFTRSAWIFDDPAINNPSLVRLADGRWRMYYMDPGSVLSAVSTDAAGTAFTVEGRRLAGASHPAAVPLPDGRLRLYYVPSAQPGAPTEVRSAISDDGLTFVEEPGVRLAPGGTGARDAFGAIHLSVVSLPGGGWRLYYDAVHRAPQGARIGFGKAVMSATSPDGLTFTRDAGARITARLPGLHQAFSVWSPEVVRDGRGFVMLFVVDASDRPQRFAGIYQARSRDGLRFTLESDRPVWGVARGDAVRPGPGGPSGVPQDPAVVQFSPTKQRLYYWLPGEGTGSAVR